VLEHNLTTEDPIVKSALIDILLFIVDVSPSMVRESILGNNGTGVSTRLVHILS
jgi:hypothetical protein